jgi:hypothetical protein
MVHTCSVGVIQSYDPDIQSASIALSFYLSDGNGTFSDPVIISNVPVFVLSGGGGSLTMPIQAGDGCLVIFGEQSIDLWKQSRGELVRPVGNNDAGMSTHNMADAIALVGVSPFALSRPAKPGTVSLSNGGSALNLTTSTVALGASGVEVISTIGNALVSIGLNPLAPNPAAVTAGTTLLAIAGSL